MLASPANHVQSEHQYRKLNRYEIQMQPEMWSPLRGPSLCLCLSDIGLLWKVAAVTSSNRSEMAVTGAYNCRGKIEEIWGKLFIWNVILFELVSTATIHFEQIKCKGQELVFAHWQIHLKPPPTSHPLPHTYTHTCMHNTLAPSTCSPSAHLKFLASFIFFKCIGSHWELNSRCVYTK